MASARTVGPLDVHGTVAVSGAGVIVCEWWLDWNGDRVPCVRDDEHDGQKQMHAGMAGGEYTNWTNDWPFAGRGQSGPAVSGVAATPESAPVGPQTTSEGAS